MRPRLRRSRPRQLPPHVTPLSCTALSRPSPHSSLRLPLHQIPRPRLLQPTLNQRHFHRSILLPRQSQRPSSTRKPSPVCAKQRRYSSSAIRSCAHSQNPRRRAYHHRPHGPRSRARMASLVCQPISPVLLTSHGNKRSRPPTRHAMPSSAEDSSVISPTGLQADAITP
jgi:hypothetical protein